MSGVESDMIDLGRWAEIDGVVYRDPSDLASALRKMALRMRGVASPLFLGGIEETAAWLESFAVKDSPTDVGPFTWNLR